MSTLTVTTESLSHVHGVTTTRIPPFNTGRAPPVVTMPSSTLRPETFDPSNFLPYVYCFIKNFIGVSGGTNTVAIDTKIEEAMDLVKSHFLFIFREEVDTLKERVEELLEQVKYLETENKFLKLTATPETLAQLSNYNSSTDNVAKST